MRDEHDTILVRTLTDSFRSQLERYGALRDLTRQLLGKLVLGRGVLSALSDGLQKKRQLLEAIERERSRVARLVGEWEQRKTEIARTDETDCFDDLLRQVTDTIREFLDDESQMRRYLEGVVSRSSTAQASK